MAVNREIQVHSLESEWTKLYKMMSPFALEWVSGLALDFEPIRPRMIGWAQCRFAIIQDKDLTLRHECLLIWNNLIIEWLVNDTACFGSAYLNIRRFISNALTGGNTSTWCFDTWYMTLDDALIWPDLIVVGSWEIPTNL